MSLGNVTSPRINDMYFQQTLAYLRAAKDLPNYSLPEHLDRQVQSTNSDYSADCLVTLTTMALFSDEFKLDLPFCVDGVPLVASDILLTRYPFLTWC